MMRAPHLTRLARTVRDDERGMTLIEMMVGVFLGALITLAAYMAMDAAMTNSTRTAMRVEALQRGRNAMESMTRAIRAQQCNGSTRPMTWASASALEFYASIAPVATTTFQPVELHRIQWEAQTTPTDLKNGAKPVGDLKEYVYALDPATNKPKTTPKAVVVLAKDVEQAQSRRDETKLAPFFQYFDYDGGTGSGRIDYNAPLALSATQNGVPSVQTGDLSHIVLVEISYRVTPRRTKSGLQAGMNFYNTVSVRIADPTNPGGSPQCL
ncbi:MAG: prepilin-type N-terminal cleavage/methylation domain-containing protein [Patulibacter minatonensis]